MNKIKKFIGNCIYFLFIPLSIISLIIIELIDIIYNFIYNLLRFRKISKQENDN